MKYFYFILLSHEFKFNVAFKNDDFFDIFSFGEKKPGPVETASCMLYYPNKYSSNNSIWCHVIKVSESDIDVNDCSVKFSIDNYVTTYGDIKKISLPS